MSKNKKKQSRLCESESGQRKESTNRFMESGRLLLSFVHVLDCESYGLIVNRDHKHYNNGKRFNEEVLKMFQELSQHSWDNLQQKGKKGGLERLDIDQAKFKNRDKLIEVSKRLGYLSDKNIKVCVVRFNSQKMRCIGFRKEDTFYIVCFDYDCTLYNHGC